MMMERWQQIESIYQEAADLDPGERAAFLDQACGTDPMLRKEVQDLLAADPEFDSAIEAVIQKEAEELASRESESVIGKRIGPYRVTAVIAAGGMGTVYRAVRDDDQFQKEVAIKVVKRGMDSDAVLNRFRRERQILAQLDHPYVARLLDGGATDTGQPYFVMEYVEGRPLTEHCAGKPLEERLGLFRQVCAAVQYAHQNLIVHRDLKPGNILVTQDGVPKLLDFGLAKLLNPDQVADGTFTMVRILTPDYASPEQVRGEPITTASDIYSLGAVLYELVSGHRAHRFQNRATSEMERVVCQTDPPALAGELGSIVQMAMRKEPQDRYATVEQLSEDVRRYLEGLPVIARKDTLFYTARKFVRRNKLAAAAVLLAVISLVSGTTVAIIQARRLQRQVEQVRKLANTMLFDVSSRIERLPGSLEARETLVKTGLEYLDRVTPDAGNDPELQWELARGYGRLGNLQGGSDIPRLHIANLGDSEGALRSHQTALGLAESLLTRDHRKREVREFVATLHQWVGWLTDDSGEAIRHFQESVRILDELGPGKFMLQDLSQTVEDSRHRADASLGAAYLRAGDPRAALDVLRPLHALSPTNFYGPRYFALASAVVGDLAAATDVWRKWVEFGARRLVEIPEGRRRNAARGAIWANAGLGHVMGNPLHLNLGDTAAAIRRHRNAVAIAEANILEAADALGHSDLASALNDLAGSLRDENPAESVETYRKGIGEWEELIKAAPRNREYRDGLAEARWQIGHPLLKLGRRDEAFDEVRQSLAMVESTRAHNALGDLLLDAGDRTRALDEYRRALEMVEKEVAAKPFMMPLRRDLADCYERLGAYHAAARQWSEARDWYRKSLTVWQEWTKWGVSSVYDQRRAREAEQAVAKYGRLLPANPPE
jgi:eukaryotic-like serine/threonine-protein kinase